VDITGANGYSTSDYYLYSGTCGSTPHVSGVMALMLEANPNLGYRDVYEILAYSAVLTADEAWQWQDNGAGNWNGGGLHVSHRAGYGLVDARAAVRLAETWQSVSTAANEVVVSGSSAASRTLVDNGAISDSIVVGAGVTVDRVEIDLNITHGWVGDLVVTLISPDGTESVLVNRPGKYPDDPNALGAGSQNFVYTNAV
jgi:subtilisin family serine protease